MRYILVLTMIGLALLLIGCSYSTDAIDIQISPNNVLEEYDVAIEGTKQVDFNCDKFLRKIWISNEGHQEHVYFSSFRLDKVVGYVIYGHFVTRAIAFPPVYKDFDGEFSDFAEHVPHRSNMRLILEGNIAKGYFDTGHNSGYISLDFTKYGIIYATVEYTKRDRWSHNLQDGRFIYHPLNIDNLDGFYLSNHLAFVESNLEYPWEDTYFVAGEFRGNMRFPSLFLTDSERNILYDFGITYPTWTRVYSIKVDDFNDDGLLDVFVVTDDNVLEEKSQYFFSVYWHLYQLINGWFHLVPGEMP